MVGENEEKKKLTRQTLNTLQSFHTQHKVDI